MPEKRTTDDLLRDLRIQDHAREATFDRATVDTKARTVELSFSSETPYKRWWGTEVLSHEADAVNLERLNGGANLLINHGWDNYVGVVDNARIDGDRRGRASVRFGSGAHAQEVWQDVQDGILRSVSVGYKIEDMILQRDSEDTGEEYLVTKWTPYEISLVTVPADQSVGVGRSQSPSQPAEPAKQHGDDMTDKTAPAGDTAENRKAADVQVGIDHKAAEDSRIETIKHVCRQADIDEGVAAQWILEGVTIQAAQQRAMDVLTERHSNFKRAASNVGLSRREIQQYSISRMIEAVANKNPGKAGLENEVHQTLQQKLNRLPGEETFFLPSDKACVLVPVERGARGNSFVVPGEILSRDLATQPGSAGGYLIETANLSWIDLLRNRSVALRLGATRLTGLTGNVSIPKQTAAASAYWVTDTASITESQQTLGQLNLSPKNVGAYTEISRQLLLQSNPSAEAMVMSDLAQVVGLAVDAAMLEGTGAAGAPLGIANVTGVGSVSGTSLDAADIIEFQTDVATANVLPMRPGYVTTAAAAGLLMARPELPSTGTTRLWLGNVWDGSLFGIPAMTSQQLTALSMIFGAWEHAVLAEWGVLEIEVNPYANFQAGIRGIRAMYSVDVGIRYAAAFSRATSIT